ncbi:MAG: hypothetical protein Q9M13_07440, partial [Mariprofundales bacterium]|nr:hypothetical protein [Mariprofundales bacterium]
LVATYIYVEVEFTKGQIVTTALYSQWSLNNQWSHFGPTAGPLQEKALALEFFIERKFNVSSSLDGGR